MVAVGECLGVWAQVGLCKIKAIRIHVENGRISGDASPGLREGNVDLVLADGDDEMTEAELVRLHNALELGFAAIKAGGFRSARDTSVDRRRRPTAVTGACAISSDNSPAAIGGRNQGSCRVNRNHAVSRSATPCESRVAIARTGVSRLPSPWEGSALRGLDTGLAAAAELLRGPVGPPLATA